MFEKMRENQKGFSQNRKSIHIFNIGDLVILKKHSVDKMELKWEPNYRIVKLPSAWSAVAENQLSGKSKDATLMTSKLNTPVKIGNLSQAPVEKVPNLSTTQIIYLKLTFQWINLLISR